MNDSAKQNSRSHCNKHKAAKNEIAYLLSELLLLISAVSCTLERLIRLLLFT